MSRIHANIWCAGLLAGLLSLTAPPSLAQDADAGMSAEARKYLTDVLDKLQQHALHRDSIDWKEVREGALAKAQNAKTTTDTYVAIAYALSQLKERHSFLKLPDNLDKDRRQAIQAEMGAELSKGRTPVPPRGKRSPFSVNYEMDGHIDRQNGHTFAHVVVPQCSGKFAEWSKNLPFFEEFTKKLHSIVQDLLAQKPDGWIIDLRGNGGGNMWPMLAGIGSIVGEGEIGSFRSPDGGSSQWRISPPPAKLPELPWVAVLMDRDTASSGEAVAIAFAGRPRSRSFGEHTAGFSTANQNYPLPDGALLLLCSSIEVDRKGHAYEDGVDPDVVLPAPESRPQEDTDAVIKAAEDWLASNLV